MANRASLSAVEGARQRTLRIADYVVPLFWLACLAPDDGEEEFHRARSYFETPTDETATAAIAISIIDVLQGGQRYDTEDYLWGHGH